MPFISIYYIYGFELLRGGLETIKYIFRRIFCALVMWWNDGEIISRQCYKILISNSEISNQPSSIRIATRPYLCLTSPGSTTVNFSSWTNISFLCPYMIRVYGNWFPNRCPRFCIIRRKRRIVWTRMGRIPACNWPGPLFQCYDAMWNMNYVKMGRRSYKVECVGGMVLGKWRITRKTP